MDNDKTGNRIYKLVLTGGPCGGKTLGQIELSRIMESMGWQVYNVPETATILFSGGIKFPELNEKESYKFQNHLVKVMIRLEESFFDLALSCKKHCLIICDRGVMDAAAYMPANVWDRILRTNGFNEVGLRDNRYDQVIHMVSAADGAEEFYSSATNAQRTEGPELARMLDQLTANAWVGHPYFDIIDNNQTDFTQKTRNMIGTILHKMNINLDKSFNVSDCRKLKYLIQGPLPDDCEFPRFEDFELVHTYLKADKDEESRLRKRGQDGFYNYTHTTGRRHFPLTDHVAEHRYYLTKYEYEEMLKNASETHYPLVKKRRCFIYKHKYFQLDVYMPPYHPRCEDLILLECYSTLCKTELNSRLPSFLQILDEVTGDPYYTFWNLSYRLDLPEYETSKKCAAQIIPKTPENREPDI